MSQLDLSSRENSLGIQQIQDRSRLWHNRIINQAHNHPLNGLSTEGHYHEMPRCNPPLQVGGQVIMKNPRNMGDIDGNFNVNSHSKLILCGEISTYQKQIQMVVIGKSHSTAH
jgi:hypothetical protein